MSDNKGICGELVFTARIAVGRSCKTSGTERDGTCKQKMPSLLFSDRANICCCKADRRMASYPTRTVPFKVDIHYITSYITYKRYNQAIKRKHTNIYIYLYLQKRSNKLQNFPIIDSLNSPRNHSRLFSILFLHCWIICQAKI